MTLDRLPKVRPLAAVLLAGLIVVLGLATVLAATGTTKHAGGATTRTTVAGSSDPFYFAQEEGSNATRPWVDLPTAGVVAKVPAGVNGLVIVTFSYGYRCTGGPASGPGWSGGWGCDLRVLIDGQPASPGPISVASGFGNTEHEEKEGTASMQWSALVGPGKHRVTVQLHTSVGEASIDVQYLTRAWHLTAEVATPAA